MPFGPSRYLAATVAAATALAVAAPAAAVTTFKATLSGANEPVPTASSGTGTGFFTLSDDGTVFTVAIAYSGLTTPTVAGHVHCCAGPGANAAVAIGFTFPSATSGSFTQTFDLTSAAVYTNGFRNANGGSAAGARSAFLTGLGNGMVYANIHTQRFAGGEIRGQLGLVPEPATWSMMISGFGLVGGAVRRRRVVAA